MEETRTLLLDIEDTDHLGNPFYFALADSAGRALPWVVGGLFTVGAVVFAVNGITNARRKSENKNALDPTDSAFIAQQLLEAIEYRSSLVFNLDISWDRERFFEAFESIQTAKELDRVLKSFKKLNNGTDLLDQLKAEWYVTNEDFDRIRAHTNKLS